MLRDFDFDVILPSTEGWRTYKANKLLVAKVSESFFIKLFGLLSILVMSCGILFEDGLSLTTGLLSFLVVLIVVLSLLLTGELKSTRQFFLNKKAKTLKGDHVLTDFFSSRLKGGIQFVCVCCVNVCVLLGVVVIGNVGESILTVVEIMAFVYFFIALVSFLKINRLLKVVDTPSEEFKVLIKN